MNQRFIPFRRSGAYYSEDTQTGKQTSLRTKDKTDAQTLLHARNEAFRQPALNIQIARAYLAASDRQASIRTWNGVLDEIRHCSEGGARLVSEDDLVYRQIDRVANRPLTAPRSV